MPKTFVIGDIHGAYRALKQCLERSCFNYDKDTLICLGDASDGWPEVHLVFDELLKIENLVYILGNHDVWTLEWSKASYADPIWLKQGGKNTLTSYPEGMPCSHINLLEKAHLFYKLNNKLFVHAGFDISKDINNQNQHDLMLNRDFANTIIDRMENDIRKDYTIFDNVFIGHTPTIRYHIYYPFNWQEVWFMDTGAGWNGVLTIMDIDSCKYWQSSSVRTLYPGIKGRME